MSLTKDAGSLPEVWGGAECTVRRVGDGYFDHIERSGHAARPEDLALFAGLGLRALRYPVLWERTAPRGVDRADWSWADERLHRLRELGVRPIVGLVHHGSGPPHTSLVDPAFAALLAEYAQAVAERYPWVDAWTPVNEPLTTARFSGLYGHWYPHGRDVPTFWSALANQCRAVVLAMRAIRRVNPHAELIQTEDLGKVYSTPRLAYQAELENERRWLSLDLLCGRLAPADAMWQCLASHGVGEEELGWFAENACPPDVLGLNYYITSERLLDERMEHYPAWSHGGNGRDRYADVEAVRARATGIAGAYGLLSEVWERYRRPMAVTEAHLGCRRESQLRWLRDVWRAAVRLRAEGKEVRAVTAWSLLGAYDWNSLLVRLDGHYEPGVFDLRGPRPRPTALATMLKALATDGDHEQPVLAPQGWWLRPQRLVYGPTPCTLPADADTLEGRPLLITGANGKLGQAFARICRERGLAHRLLSRDDLDIAEPASITAALSEFEPWAVVNAAGYSDVNGAEADPARCRRENADGPAGLARACAAQDLPLLTFSTDLVFDGNHDTPYVESDPPRPLCRYGQSHAEGERRVREAHPAGLVVRAGALFGPWDERNFVTAALRRLASGRPVPAAGDALISPTYIPDLVHACLDLLVDGERGIWHLASAGTATWADFVRSAARAAGLDDSTLVARPIRELRLAARRPRYSVLGSERGLLMPSLDDALTRYARECETDWECDDALPEADVADAASGRRGLMSVRRQTRE